jgi:hypothetical protein
VEAVIPMTTERAQLAWYSFRPPIENDSPRRVYIHTQTLEPLWHGLDVLHALDLENVHLVDTVTLPGVEDEDGDPVPFIDTASVRALAVDRPDFLEWVDESLARIAAGRIPRRIAPVTTIRGPRDVAPIVDVRADTFSVLTAAALISRDPGLSLGREALFDAIRELGWVKRDHDAWIPTDHAAAAGWLALNPIWQHGTKVSYNKVRVTRDGLLQLHTRLGGTVPPDLDAPPTPTLIEVR